MFKYLAELKATREHAGLVSLIHYREICPSGSLLKYAPSWEVTVQSRRPLVEVSGMPWLLLSLLKEATPCASERHIPVHIRKCQFLFKSTSMMQFFPPPGFCWDHVGVDSSENGPWWEVTQRRCLQSSCFVCTCSFPWPLPSPTDTCRWHMSSQLCAQPLLIHGWSHLLPNTGLLTSNVGEPSCLWIKWTSNLLYDWFLYFCQGGSIHEPQIPSPCLSCFI